MELKKFFTCAVMCAMVVLCASMAMAQDVVKDQVTCFTTWDDTYFYLAFKVDCPDVQATHNKPNADITGDDSIELFLETDNQHATKITPACFSMAVSAAGGSRFCVGNDKGVLSATPVWTFKYGATVQGTLNNPDDIDMGYTIETAIPWDVLKVNPPSLGNMMSFNVIVHRHGEKNGKFVSLSSRVKTEEDALDPAKWVNLVFAAHSFGVATTSAEKIVSAKYVVHSPLIDGIISDKEWHQNTSFVIDLPMPEGTVYEAKFPVQRMVFAKYTYSYQADPRKAAPVEGITNADGSPALVDFPIKNAGPWFSYDRVQWHKEELADMVSAGINIVLPCYMGDAKSYAGYAAKGLDCMVSALTELKHEGKPYPMVGMFFDADSMTAAYGKKPDMKSDEAKHTFYGMIKSFFDRIPAEYRAVAQAEKPNAGEPSAIIFLYANADELSGFDPSVISYCNDHFKNDFGCPLVWISQTDLALKVKSFDAATELAAAEDKLFDSTCRICTGSVDAGSDLPSSVSKLLNRLDGQTYEKQWSTVLDKNPQWIFCSDWNHFATGDSICASRLYGDQYLNTTREDVKQFRVSRDYSAKFLRYNFPKIIPSKAIAQAEVTIRNVGNSTWRAADGFALGYRWYKNGRFYGESRVRRPIERDVPPGDTIDVPIGIATVNSLGAAIPGGKCELRLEMIRLSDNKWFSALGDQPLMAPVNIGQPEDWDATYITCSAPVMMADGFDYPASIRVRNEGTQVWAKGVTRLGCKLYKITNYTHDGPPEASEEVPIKDVHAVLVNDCKPGEIAQFDFTLNVASTGKKPLESWKQSDPWSYQLRFDIFNGQKWLSELGVKTCNRIVDIFDQDYGPKIVDSDVPAKLMAGQTLEARVVLRNTGAQTWDPKRTKVGYHWYHLDGAELQWDGQTTPIKAAVQPGWPSVVQAKLQAPEYDGQYVLVWDMMVDGQWLSTGPLSRGGDILPIHVEVSHGRLAFADLSKLYDVIACSPDTDRSAGNFDGKGASFPEEFMLPDEDMTNQPQHLFPSGYQIDRASAPDGRISFFYPEKAKGMKNAVACNGQRVDIEPMNYAAVHILCASTNGVATGQVALNYDGSIQMAALTANDWSTPANGAKIGYMANHRHTPAGDDADTRCYLYHYTIKLDSSKKLSSITLPKNPDIKAVAITFERTGIPSQPINVEAAKTATTEFQVM